MRRRRYENTWTYLARAGLCLNNGPELRVGVDDYRKMEGTSSLLPSQKQEEPRGQTKKPPEGGFFVGNPMTVRPARIPRLNMARPERFELPTAWFVARYSIQLSYGRVSRVFCRIPKIPVKPAVARLACAEMAE